MDHDEPGNAQPNGLGAAPPVSGGLLRATPRPSTREPFPSPPLAPRLGWDRYDDRTGMRFSEPAAVGVPGVPGGRRSRPL